MRRFVHTPTFGQEGQKNPSESQSIISRALSSPFYKKLRDERGFVSLRPCDISELVAKLREKKARGISNIMDMETPDNIRPLRQKVFWQKALFLAAGKFPETVEKIANTIDS